MSGLPSQYAEEVETFRHILDLPDPRETMPRSSTTVLGLDDEKGFLASNLPEDKYIKPLLQQQNGTRWDSLVLRTNYISLIVSTGSIRWILWFSVRYAAAAAARREIFGINALRGKQQQLGSPNLQDIFIGG